MTNPNRPHGFVPVGTLNGAAWNGQTRRYFIAASDMNAYYIGDPVVISSGGSDGSYQSLLSQGIQLVTKAAAGNMVRGVISDIIPDIENLEFKSIPATKKHAYFIDVVDDPTVTFEIQADGDVTPAALGSFANFTIATPTNKAQVSNVVLATSTISSVNTSLPLRILGLVQGTFGLYARLLVQFNLHDLASTGKGAVTATTDAVTGVVTYSPAGSGATPRGFPIVLVQTALPMILPSSGTMGANGSLTGLTTLPYPAFPQPCFMYFPAGTVYSGSLAGLYFANILTATTATVYSNQYSSGTPAIPVSPTPVVDAGPGAYTQTTAADITLLSATLPGGLMGPNGALRCYQIRGMSNNANNKIHRTKVSVTDMLGGLTTTTAAEDIDWRMLHNRGDAAKQVCNSNWSSFGTNTFPPLYSYINTAVDQPILATGNLAVATDFIVLESFTLEVLPG